MFLHKYILKLYSILLPKITLHYFHHMYKLIKHQCEEKNMIAKDSELEASYCFSWKKKNGRIRERDGQLRLSQIDDIQRKNFMQSDSVLLNTLLMFLKSVLCTTL
jgi:hypothetical protein